MIIISLNKLKQSKLKKCDFKDDLFIEGITSYDNERHHFKIARKSFFVENGHHSNCSETDNLHMKSHSRNF